MPSPLKFNGGCTISFAVKDRKATSKWYTEVLGLTLLYDVAEIGWCELATETKGLNIGLSDGEKPKVGGGPTPTFGVDDIEKARAMLEAKKVRFDGPIREYPGMVKLATFFDPDGHSLMLFQDLSGK